MNDRVIGCIQFMWCEPTCMWNCEAFKRFALITLWSSIAHKTCLIRHRRSLYCSIDSFHLILSCGGGDGGGRGQTDKQIAIGRTSKETKRRPAIINYAKFFQTKICSVFLSISVLLLLALAGRVRRTPGRSAVQWECSHNEMART